MTPPNSPLYAALVALVNALFGALTAFHAFPLTEEQRTAVLGLFTAGFVLATLLAAWFHHSNMQMTARLRSGVANPAMHR